MMIVIPMLLESVTFGTVYKVFLHGDPRSAITFAGILLLVAAGTTLRIRRAPTGQQRRKDPPPEPDHSRGIRPSRSFAARDPYRRRVGDSRRSGR